MALLFVSYRYLLFRDVWQHITSRPLGCHPARQWIVSSPTTLEGVGVLLVWLHLSLERTDRVILHGASLSDAPQPFPVKVLEGSGSLKLYFFTRYAMCHARPVSGGACARWLCQMCRSTTTAAIPTHHVLPTGMIGKPLPCGVFPLSPSGHRGRYYDEQKSDLCAIYLQILSVWIAFAKAVFLGQEILRSLKMDHKSIVMIASSMLEP